MLDYLFSMVAGFWIGMSALLYAIFYWIEEVWDLPVTKTESASSAHSRLQQLVQRVIEEALHLPAFLDCSGIDRDAQGRLPEFSPNTYEDLLATAILNKVIDRYQHDLKRSAGASSSGVHSGSSSPDGGGSGLGRRPSRTRPRGRDSSPEQSSLEPASHDDYAHSDSSGRATDGTAVKEIRSLHNSDSSTDDEGHYTASYSNPVDGALSNINFQNKARVIFPEYGGDVVEKNGISLDSQEYAEGSNHNDSNDGLNQNSDIYANNNSWEENWLFQKKRMKTGQSVPVPMLIPNSNTEYRALIGDRDAEDTTDLSEAGSETDDTPTDIKQVLVNSKTIIGGKNPELVLTLIDQDIIEKSAEMETTIEDEKNLDVTVIEKKILPTKIDEDVGKDENDNQPIWEAQLISLTQDPSETFEEVPKTKNDMREFLKSLESDGEGDAVDGRSGEVSHIEVFDVVSTPFREELQDVFSKENVTEATNFDVVDKKDEENLDSLNGHQQESEYIETIAKPVQRHMDSLKRQHYKPAENDKTSDNEEEPPPPLPTSKLPDPSLIKTEEEIIAIVTTPGSIAEREHKKWLNAVPMENNPYSPEAIERRLSKQSNSSLYDMVSKTNLESTQPEKKTVGVPLQMALSEGGSDPNVRYGRDYYINASKKATGARKRLLDMKFDSMPDEASNTNTRPKTMTRSTSEAATPVSFNNLLNDLEGSALHENIRRVCMRSKNASHGFAVNPLFENTDTNESPPSIDIRRSQKERDNEILTDHHSYLNMASNNADSDSDSIKLNIPKEPEVLETNLHTLSSLRLLENRSLRKHKSSQGQRAKLETIFGGSLRLRNSNNFYMPN